MKAAFQFRRFYDKIYYKIFNRIFLMSGEQPPKSPTLPKPPIPPKSPTLPSTPKEIPAHKETPQLEPLWYGVKDSIDRVFGEDIAFGKSGPGKKPDGLKKNTLTWSDDVEVEPQNPLVDVAMNIDSWGKFLVSHDASKRQHQTMDSLEIETENGTVSFTPRIMIWNQILSVSMNFRNFNEGITTTASTWTQESFKDFYEAFIKYLRKNLTKIEPALGQYVSRNDEYSCKLKFNFQDVDKKAHRALLEHFKKAVATSLEVLLKMFKKDGRLQYRIDNPVSILKETHTSPSSDRSGSQEIIDKVNALEVSDVKLTLEDMGGNPELKEQIKMLVAQHRTPEFFRERGVSLPKGILLYGPPGTGKTLAAKIFAGEIHRKFYHIRTTDILSKYYGESEETVKNIFKHVKGPCIIFIDEIDAIGENRERASEPTKRVITELLQQIDGMSSRSDIILLAATNRKDSLDPALVRAGRFDLPLFVDRPDQEGRKQIWQIHLTKQQKNSEVKIFDEIINLDLLAQETEGLVGADIEEIIRRLKQKAVYQSFINQKDIVISTQMLSDEIKAYRKEKENEEKEKKRHIGFMA